MPVLPEERYVAGHTFESFLEASKVNADEVRKNHALVRLPDAEREFFSGLRGRGLRALVITEDWCGDSVANLPVLARICEVADLEMRIFPRDQNLDLMDQFLTDGKRSIPVFVFLDRDLNFVARWNTRPAGAHALRAELLKLLPPEGSPNFEEARKRAFKQVRDAYYTTDFWQQTAREIRAALEDAFAAGARSA